MTPSFRYIAPAGAPVRLRDMAQWAAAALSCDDARARLSSALRANLGVEHVLLMASGRAALTILLRAMRILTPDRDEVVVPGYTCYSVAAAVAKAGLRLRVVDTSTSTLDYDLDALRATDLQRTLAVIATNLYGLPSDLPAIREVARSAGAFVIDDAAQSLGATADGEPSGSRGDAGLLSFDKGKAVPAMQGGAIVTADDAVSCAVTAQVSALGVVDRAAPLAAVKAVAAALLIRPSWYWIPNGIPALGLGRTTYSTDYPLDGPAVHLSALALTMLARLAEFTAARRLNAARWQQALADVADITPATVLPGASPAYLRYPVLVSTAEMRDAMVRQLNAAGIGASSSYPEAIVDVPDAQPLLVGVGTTTGARHVARHIVTLPTHSFVGIPDIARATDALNLLFGSVPR